MHSNYIMASDKVSKIMPIKHFESFHKYEDQHAQFENQLKIITQCTSFKRLRELSDI